MKKSTKIISLILALLLMITVLPLSANASKNDYTDIKKDDWFYDAVMYVQDKGIMAGTSLNTFSPHQKITRSNFVQLIYNWQNRPHFDLESLKFKFDDVNPNDWFYVATMWVCSNGILSGHTTTSYKPNDYMTREEIALCMLRYSKFINIDEPYSSTKLRTFSDYKSVSPWAEDGMNWMTTLGVYKGDNKNCVNPQGLLSRAELAQIIYNIRVYL